MALVGMLLTDLTVFWSQGMRDFRLDLKAGARFLAGQPVYLQSLVTGRPSDLTDYPFLYPPFTLPFYAALSRLPAVLAEGIAVAVWLAAAVGGLRLLGVDLRWSIVMLIWPPFQQGIFVGNIAVPMFFFFAAAPWMLTGLMVPPLFKAQSGVASLWLLRERRWRSFVAGVAVVGVLILATLPIVGAAQWAAYIEGLGLYRASQTVLPEFLYGIGMPRFVPYWLFVVAAGVAIALALCGRGRDGLSRLGVASVVVSPSLFPHGFLVALPAMLSLRTTWFWLAMAITATAPGLGWWMAVALVGAGFFVPALRRQPVGAEAEVPSEALHPLRTHVNPWPNARFDGAEGPAVAPLPFESPAPAPVPARALAAGDRADQSLANVGLEMASVSVDGAPDSESPANAGQGLAGDDRAAAVAIDDLESPRG